MPGTANDHRRGRVTKRRTREKQKTDARLYDGKELSERLRSMHISILVFCKMYNAYHAEREKVVSRDYRHERYLRLATMMLKELPRLGYEVTSLLKIKPKHTEALTKSWVDQGLSPKTIQKKRSTLSWVLKKLRKSDCLPDCGTVVQDPGRIRVETATRVEKTPSSRGIDMEGVYARIAEVNPLVALQLRAQETFGLRTKEAVRLRPYEADRHDHLLITVGSKGGRPRTVSCYDFEADFDLDADEVVFWNVREDAGKRKLIEAMKGLTRPGRSLIPIEYTLEHWLRYVREVAERCGFTNAVLGVTPHGLRHEYLCRRAETISGLPRALRRTAALTRREVIRDRVARQIAAIDAGHHDTYTTETYYGARTEKAPQGIVRRIARCLRGSVREPLLRCDASGRIVPGKGRRIRVLDAPPDWYE